MKLIVHVLLVLAVFLPLSGFAREETPEERKQRVVRKYLREKSAVVDSGLEAPSQTAEERQVLDSEKFAVPQVDIAREDRVTMPPPPARRPVPQSDDRNWLLSEEADPAADPYADPFGDPFGFKEPAKTERDPAKRSWGFNREEDSYSAGRRGQSESRLPLDSGMTDPVGYSGLIGKQNEGDAQQRGYGGRQTQGYEPTAMPGLFGKEGSPDAGLLKTPFQTRSAREEDRSGGRAPAVDGYMPYRSPFQTGKDRQQRGYADPQEPPPQFQRTTPYEQWKGRNDSLDPTKDDAYLDEMMKRNRR